MSPSLGGDSGWEPCSTPESPNCASCQRLPGNPCRGTWLRASLWLCDPGCSQLGPREPHHGDWGGISHVSLPVQLESRNMRSLKFSGLVNSETLPELVLLPHPVGDKVMLLGGCSRALSSFGLLGSPHMYYEKLQRRRNILPRDIGRGNEAPEPLACVEHFQLYAGP